MDLPILEDDSSSSKKLGNSLEDIDTANKAADPIHHSTVDKDVSVEEDDQQQEDVFVEEDDCHLISVIYQLEVGFRVVSYN